MDFARDRQPLKHPVNLSGLTVGDFFYFCDKCGYQHKTGFTISGRECPKCGHGSALEPMFHCRVTEEDRVIWNSAIHAAADATGEPYSAFEFNLVKPKPP